MGFVSTSTAIIAPDGSDLCEPVKEGEGMAIADLDFNLITKRKRMLDSVGHFSRPDLFELRVDRRSRSAMHTVPTATVNEELVEYDEDPHISGGAGVNEAEAAD